MADKRMKRSTLHDIVQKWSARGYIVEEMADAVEADIAAELDDEQGEIS